jgi:hypothetical protein
MTLPNPIDILKMMVRAVPAVIEHLSEDAIKAAGYDGIRTVLNGAVFGSVFGYLSGGSLSDANNRMATAVSRAYIETVELAYVEGGGSLPLDEETTSWAREQIEIQFGYIDQLFDDLKELRKSGDFDAGEVATARAEGYASGLDQIWSEAKTRGAANKMLTFVGDDGKESCKDCKRMKGQRHKASWWISHDMVPGSSSYECGGWNCEHFLQDDQGNQFTV